MIQAPSVTTLLKNMEPALLYRSQLLVTSCAKKNVETSTASREKNVALCGGMKSNRGPELIHADLLLPGKRGDKDNMFTVQHMSRSQEQQ